MGNLLLIVIFNAIAIIGLQGATHSGMVLHGISQWLELRLCNALFKPLFGCPRCMASLWAGIPFLAFFIYRNGLDWTAPLFTFSYVCAVSGLVRVIDSMLDFLGRE